MSVISNFGAIKTDFADMKYPEAPLLPSARAEESVTLGVRLARLRKARRLRQAV